jgi:hypothetical protein
MEELVTFLDYLVRPAYKVKIILFEEAINNRSTVFVTDSSLKVVVPPRAFQIGIRPQQIRNYIVFTGFHGSFYHV